MQTKWLLYALFLPAGILFATTGNWLGSAADGNWATGSNWVSATIPGGAAGDVAIFANGPPAPTSTTITINTASPVLLGTLSFDYGLPYTITATGTQTFQMQAAGSTPATISVTSVNGNGAHTIAHSIVLASPLAIAQGSAGALTISGAITETGGSRSVTTSGTGTIVFSNTGNSYSGGTVIGGGNLSIDSDAELGNTSGSVTISGATLAFTNASALSSARSFALTGAAILNTAGANSVTLTGVISGTGSLQKTGNQTLVLTASNTYQGGTTVAGGTLSVSSDANLGSSTSSLQINGATLLTTSNFTSARSGSFSGAAVIDTNGNTDVLSGNFSGSGALTVQGGGTLTLTGANSYTGTTSITAAGTTLISSTSSTPGNVSIGTGSSFSFNQSSSGTYAGVLSGSGQLTKTGTGAVTLTGNSASFSGATAVSQGTLLVNGSLAGSSVTVATGATLGGNGTVGPTTNSGTIAPGTLAINGALILNAPSTVNIGISPLSSSLLAVNGAATLNGALAVTVTPGVYSLSASYTILTSTALTPAFTTVTSDNANFVPTVSYMGNDVILTVAVLEPFAFFSFSNQNTEAVGNNINALYAAGELPSGLAAIFDSFIGQDSASVNSALDQMHPAPYSALTEIQVEVDAQLLSLFHRWPALSCGYYNPYRFWLEPFGNSLTVKSHGEEVGFQGNSGGIALGFDAQIDRLVLGVGGAWNRNHLEWHRHQGKGTSDGFYGGLYMDYISPKQFYFGASLLAGVDFYDTSRHIQFFDTNEHAKADFNALDIMAQVAFAQLFGSPTAYFYPYANIDFLYLNSRTFTEHGASSLDLTVHHRGVETVRSELGLALQVQDSNIDETLCLSPKFAIGWVNMTPLQRPGFKATFEGASIPFTTYGWDQTWNLLALDFGLKFSGRTFTLGAEYNLELSPDSHTLYFNQHGNVQFSWSW